MSQENDKQIGRYAISGDWRLDTKTGEVEKLSVIYDRQMRAVAKELESAIGLRIISIEGYQLYQPPKYKIIRPYNGIILREYYGR